VSSFDEHMQSQGEGEHLKELSRCHVSKTPRSYSATRHVLGKKLFSDIL